VTAWQLIFLPALSAWIALVEVDAVLVGQWMLSRPIFVGPLTGLLCGNVRNGVALGVLTELFSVEALPVGASMPLNASVAAGCAVLLSAGAWAVPMAAAFPVGLGLGAGHQWLETRVRQWRSSLTLRTAHALGEGEFPDWRRLLLLSLGAHVAATAAFVYAAISCLGPVLSWSWDASPSAVRGALTFAFEIGPWIGLAALLRAFARKA
jgi:mannose/fructose/N-acetylgalactosamine-specific phosphotransferase system component IIC